MRQDPAKTCYAPKRDQQINRIESSYVAQLIAPINSFLFHHPIVTMPKASKVGRFRASGRDVNQSPLLAEHAASAVTAAKVASSDSKEAGKNSNNKQALSRGQRKRQAKREQYLKREKMVLASLRLKRKEEQKGKLDGLGGLRDALLPISAADKKVDDGVQDGKKNLKKTASSSKTNDSTPCGTNRAKKNLAGREMAHMNLVLEHPAFKADPFATLQEHLKNTFSGQADELKKTAETEAEEEKKKDAEKKKAKKEKLKDTKKSWMKKKRRQAKQIAAAKSNGGKRGRRR